MRNRIALFALLALTACAGGAARKHVLLPQVQRAWTGVRADVNAGLDEGLASGRLNAPAAAELGGMRDQFGTAVDAGDVATIVRLWPRLRVEAELGINSNTSRHPGATESLRERLRQFTEAVAELARGQ